MQTGGRSTITNPGLCSSGPIVYCRCGRPVKEHYRMLHLALLASIILNTHTHYRQKHQTAVFCISLIMSSTYCSNCCLLNLFNHVIYLLLYSFDHSSLKRQRAQFGQCLCTVAYQPSQLGPLNCRYIKVLQLLIRGFDLCSKDSNRVSTSRSRLLPFQRTPPLHNQGQRYY